MAIPCVGGMAVQLITFLLAPCLYCMVMEWRLSRETELAGASGVDASSG
jgi:hypothetical protein